MQDSGSLAMFKVTARDQGHYKGPSGAFVTYCNFFFFLLFFFLNFFLQLQKSPSQLHERKCFIVSGSLNFSDYSLSKMSFGMQNSHEN